MTPNERAEKIWDVIDDYQNTDSYLLEWKVNILPFIVAELEAVRRDALEEAAKVVEGLRCNDKGENCYPCDCGGEIPQYWMSKAIRALQLPEQKEKV